MAGEQMNEVNREFESLGASLSRFLNDRLRNAFQISTIREGTTFYGSRPYFAPGSFPNQTGPSAVTGGLDSMAFGLGDSAPMTFNLMDSVFSGLPSSPTANPESVPPVGPEESIRYSCVNGLCLQDPNGQYYGIEECQESGCSIGPGTDIDGGGGTTIIGSGQAYLSFKAEITGSTGPTTTGGKNYWTYSWIEITTLGNARNSTDDGYALNEFELTVANSGGNVVPATATLTRLKIPTGTRLDMYVDELGAAWFCLPNPLEVTCT